MIASRHAARISQLMILFFSPRHLSRKLSSHHSIKVAMKEYYLFMLYFVVAKSDYSQDCVMRLGQYGQGFDIQCTRPDQIQAFNQHLREKVLLPMVIKMALRTDLCGISEQLEKYGKIFGFRHTNKRERRTTLQEPSEVQEWLNQLSDVQLESLLKELNGTIDNNDTSTYQSQSQIQEIHTEIHTHKHVYVYYSDSGQLVALPPFADSLDNSSLAQLVEMIEDNQPNPTPVSTSSDDGHDPTGYLNKF